jgi:hypothetical protein
LHDAFNPYCRRPHEKLRSVEARHQVVATCRQDDVLFAENGAAGHHDPGSGLREQGADDVQGVRHDLHVLAFQVCAHLQRGRATVDDHTFAGGTQARCRLADGGLLGRVPGDIFAEWNALQPRTDPCRGAILRNLCPTVNARDASFRLEASRRRVAGVIEVSRLPMTELSSDKVASGYQGPSSFFIATWRDGVIQRMKAHLP